MKLPRFPWSKREIRQDAGYTDAIVRALLAASTGEVTSGLTAGVEIAAGWWQRAFQSAELQPAGVVADMIQPHLGFIGRSLVQRGEAIFHIDTEDGLTLLPALTATVDGGPNPRSWSYELTLPGPSETITRTVAADRVLHLTYATSAANPWKGISPVEASGTTRKLIDNLEKRLAEEAGESVGYLIPVPNVNSTAQLQTDIRGLKGEVALVQSVNTGWGEGQGGVPTGDFQPRRIGANIPPSSVQLSARRNNRYWPRVASR